MPVKIQLMDIPFFPSVLAAHLFSGMCGIARKLTATDGLMPRLSKGTSMLQARKTSLLLFQRASLSRLDVFQEENCEVHGFFIS